MICPCSLRLRATLDLTFNTHTQTNKHPRSLLPKSFQTKAAEIAHRDKGRKQQAVVCAAKWLKAHSTLLQADSALDEGVFVNDLIELRTRLRVCLYM